MPEEHTEQQEQPKLGEKTALGGDAPKPDEKLGDDGKPKVEPTVEEKPGEEKV